MNHITKAVMGACTAAVILLPASASADHAGEPQGPRIAPLTYGRCVASPERGSIPGTPSPAKSGTAPGVALIDLTTGDANKDVGPLTTGHAPEHFTSGVACGRDVGVPTGSNH